ncbi:MAG: PepSY domain-containing protein [Terriglobales bacterium]
MKSTVLACAVLMAFGLSVQASAQQKKDDQATLRKEAKISVRQAEQTALKKEPGTIKSKELEKENGKVIYSFDIRTKTGSIHEVNVDAINGNIVEDSVESKAAEQQEKMQDANHH